MPLQMAREHEDLYLIILKYYRGTALANQKGNPDYHTGYTYIKLEFATALNVRTQEKSGRVKVSNGQMTLIFVLILYIWKANKSRFGFFLRQKGLIHLRQGFGLH